MNKLRRILVAVKNPAKRSQAILRKAGQLAAASGASVELFHAISQPVYMDAFLLEGQSLQQIQKQWKARLLAQLEKLAAPLRESGVATSVSCEWDFPPYEAVIRRAQQARVDLIIAERHATRHLLPWLLRFNDWELLRRSPVPVLLIKNSRAWKRPAVLAAIDPSHSFAKPTQLDAGILAAANLLKQSLGGKLHVAHAWPGTMLPTESLGPVSVELSASVEKQATRDARAAFNDTIQNAGVTGVSKHFVTGHAADVIPALARKQHAGIVVMGAISRSGLKRLVIGNIAEQVLDALQCDVLVMKPANFTAKVSSRKRGVQLVPTPPYI